MGEISNKEIISSPLIQTACYITGQTCTYFHSDNYSFWNPIYCSNMSLGFIYFLKLRQQWWSPHRNGRILHLTRMLFPRQYIGNIIGKDMKMFVISSKWSCKINLPYSLHQLLSIQRIPVCMKKAWDAEMLPLHFMDVMTMSSNGGIFHVTGPLFGEFTGQWWIPLKKASDMELWCFLWSGPEQMVE